MTKKDLIESVSQKAKLSKKAAKQAVETFLSEVMKALASGETVKLSGFGTFKTKMFKAKTIKAIGSKESKKRVFYQIIDQITKMGVLVIHLKTI
jgi:nucleoid DNA-binding protein